ncbi:hypothetical protein MKX03_006144 [Papaver bracteatum]|nr:hypothetical protein MKX03_006144 [Papaver bracteatum]
MAKAKKLRAFISTATRFTHNSYVMQFFMNFNYLRVLDLSGSSISELPPSMEKWIHLRYLNLSHCRELKELPSSLTTLYNLQTLILKGCARIKYLPADMRNLTRLSHLIFNLGNFGRWFPPMPKQLRSFTSLTYLPIFVVGNKKDGFGIEELRDLNLLGGKLRIYHLENVSNGKDAKEGGIKEKQNILRLDLHWEHDISCYRDYDFEVLEGLQPHQNLKTLGLFNYLDSKFPAWVMNPKCLLPYLVHVVLENCGRCECLPPFGLLPFLKVLIIVGFGAMKSIGSCNDKLIVSLVESNQSSLTSINIFECNEFVSLPLGLVRGNSILQRFEIIDCDDFQGFSNPNIDVEDNLFPNQVLPSNSVHFLEQRNCVKLDIEFGDSQQCVSAMESIIKKRSGIEYLPKLVYLQISSLLEELDSFPFPDASIEEEEGKGSVFATYFPSLCSLSLQAWSRVKCLPNQIQYITSLEVLKISKFESLVALPEWLGELASLSGLHIRECRNLKFLPSHEQMLRLTSLERLHISSCSFKREEEAYKINPKVRSFVILKNQSCLF